MLKKLHNKSIHDQIFVPKEGQRGLLCSNKKSCRCPSLVYEYIEDQEKLDKAFDFLFEQLFSSDNETKL
jgi:hypothetical protein